MLKNHDKHWKEAMGYAEGVRDGTIVANNYQRKAVERFFKDLDDPRYEMKPDDADFCLNVIESTLCHAQGEAIDGTPMRGTPFLLMPFDKFIVYNLVGFKLKGTDILRFHEAMIFLPRKNSKALSLDTQIPTPLGWKTMGELHAGDVVFGADGKPSKIIAESEIFNKPMYAVTFEDGSVIKTSADHIWTVQTKDSRRTARRPLKYTDRWVANSKLGLRETGGWFDITTEEMLADYVSIRNDGNGHEYKYRVPMCEPVEYPEKDLPIDPYTLGVWLGDGDSTSARITCADADKDEMMEHLRSFGHTTKWYTNAKRAGAIGVDIQKKGKRWNPIIESLDALNLRCNKHIPDMYMTASAEQRLLLLQGLMDTDGTVSKAGQCTFVQKKKEISEQVKELCESLGIKASLIEREVECNGKPAGKAYAVSFFTDKTRPCFRFKRKRDRLKEKLAPRMHAKSIVSIERIPNEPSKCIAIDNDTHLYLAGKDYTATHNTSFVAGLAWSLSLLFRKSGSKCYIASSALIQSLEAFNFLTYNIKNMGEWDKEGGCVHINDNHNEHSFTANLPDGSIFVKALAASVDKQDSLNANLCICDELHSYTTPKQYNLFKQCQKAYTNKLLIGISSAGDNEQGFLGQRLKYCKNVLDGMVEDEQYFIFLCEADPDENGDIDYTNPIVHQMANPGYGVTIRPNEILNDALQAQNSPQERKDFLSKSLNVFTTAMKAWFNVDEFRASDKKYTWTLEELARLPVRWYGGADLSRMYDLTAAALYGRYEGVDIIITHAFFPVTQAAKKADEDGIPLYGWQDDGWLTMCNSPTVNVSDVVNWFLSMKAMGFRIVQVGHDRKFAGEEYFPAMRKAGFRIKDIPQYFYLKSQGFRHIEKSAKDGTLYYLHSEAYEYCVSNVRAVEKTDDAVQYEKIQPQHRIDLFDASVFACVCCFDGEEVQKKVGGFFGK